jgi:hypothetical protein
MVVNSASGPIDVISHGEMTIHVRPKILDRGAGLDRCVSNPVLYWMGELISGDDKDFRFSVIEF